MKILHVITRSQWGGAQKIVYILARSQHLKGHEVTVMCGEKGPLVQRLQEAGLKVKLNPYLWRKLSVYDVLAFAKLWLEGKNAYDIIHAHSSKAGVLARFTGALSGIPVCFTVHGFGITAEHSRFKQFLYHKVESFLARFSDALVFVSQADKEVAQRQGWLKAAGYATVIPNGIELGPEVLIENPLLKKLARQELGIPDSAYVVGNLARVAWVKNPDFWLKVAERILEKYADSYFVWFGGGDELAQYQNARDNFGGRIRFLGETTDIDKALAVMDVLFLSSRSEGMPLAVLEAMSRKIPAVTPALPGLVEILQSGGAECGLTFQPGNIPEAVSALSRLLDPVLRTTVADNAYAKCRKLYSAERMVLDYEKLYYRIHNSPSNS